MTEEEHPADSILLCGARHPNFDTVCTLKFKHADEMCSADIPNDLLRSSKVVRRWRVPFVFRSETGMDPQDVPASQRVDGLPDADGREKPST